MARKSRKAAVRYSQLSKEKKKKPKNGISFESRVASDASNSSGVDEVLDTTWKPTAEKKPLVKRVIKAQDKAIQALPKYDYVRDDLKRIGIFSGVVVVILIILTFILG